MKKNNHVNVEIIRNEQTKQVTERRIYINKDYSLTDVEDTDFENITEENDVSVVGEVLTKKSIGIDENIKTPIDEKVKDNNTSINNINNNIYSLVINYLNEKANKKYKDTTRKTKADIRARLNEKFTLEDFKKVIDIKVKEWQNTEMDKYLRPETLFGNKFESYLNQKQDQDNQDKQKHNKTAEKQDVQYNTDFSEYDGYE